MSWFSRVGYLNSGDLENLVSVYKNDINFSPSDIVNAALTVKNKKHYITNPSTGKMTVSMRELEWFWDEMRDLFVLRGGKEEAFPLLIPPAAF
jgi:hypothetical protein